MFARWNLTSSKLRKSDLKFKRKTRKQGQLLNESGFVLCIAPPSLSRDTRMEMMKSINQSVRFLKGCLEVTLSELKVWDLFPDRVK